MKKIAVSCNVLLKGIKCFHDVMQWNTSLPVFHLNFYDDPSHKILKRFFVFDLKEFLSGILFHFFLSCIYIQCLQIGP